jgi:FKBP-type peptidyl-prolyl cis-trans isomerase FkpA
MTLPLRLRSPLMIALSIAASGCGATNPVAPDQNTVAYSQTDLTVGTGATATPGKTVSVQEVGWLYSTTAADHRGTQIDASTFSFVLGAGTVIKGFDQGVTGMMVGGTRRLIIPPALAYGATGSGPTPPNTALVFDVTLVGVQ